MPADSGTAAAHRLLLRLYAFLLADELVPPLPGMVPAKLRDPPARYDIIRVNIRVFALVCSGSFNVDHPLLGTARERKTTKITHKRKHMHVYVQIQAVIVHRSAYCS